MDEKSVVPPIKVKRGRRSKQQIAIDTQKELDDIRNGIIPKTETIKKRGRKPKGGKIIKNRANDTIINNIIPNVMLHLKCSLSDLCENSIIDDNVITPYNQQTYENINIEFNQKIYKDDELSKIPCTKDIYNKINDLQRILHTDTIINNNSNCFWCTCPFDTPYIHIPKYVLNNIFHVYGCYCSPECAAGYLLNESIDNTDKFERYQLLNNLYTKIYNYTKNIKPAPSPFYTLDKYCGTLTIQEYRLLLRSDKWFYIVDKPLTMVVPELHEDNGGYLSNKTIDSNIIVNNNKNICKHTIVNNIFGS
jgi:hypothetical protein